jgi:hypothetical protein
VRKPSARAVVGAFAVTRVAIGLAFALAPERLARGSRAAVPDTMMTRSFAVRELVLGVGGLWSVLGAGGGPSEVRVWAGLGALTDAGDVCAAWPGVRADDGSARIPALVAAGGLLCELWAFRAATSDPRGVRVVPPT